jgi:hypothetical protein
MTLDLRFYLFDTYNVPTRRSTGAFPDHVEVHSALRRHAAGVGALVRGRAADKGYSRPCCIGWRSIGRARLTPLSEVSDCQIGLRF